MKRFIIVKEESLEALETRVNELLELGYTPCGRIMDTFHLMRKQWVVAMIKEK